MTENKTNTRANKKVFSEEETILLTNKIDEGLTYEQLASLFDLSSRFLSEYIRGNPDLYSKYKVQTRNHLSVPHKFFTEKDKELIISYSKEGKTHKEMALALGRTELSVKHFIGHNPDLRQDLTPKPLRYDIDDILYRNTLRLWHEGYSSSVIAKKLKADLHIIQVALRRARKQKILVCRKDSVIPWSDEEYSLFLHLFLMSYKGNVNLTKYNKLAKKRDLRVRSKKDILSLIQETRENGFNGDDVIISLDKLALILQVDRKTTIAKWETLGMPTFSLTKSWLKTSMKFCKTDEVAEWLCDNLYLFRDKRGYSVSVEALMWILMQLQQNRLESKIQKTKIRRNA
jgi:transcriptional regulator with XRE-family HTH domain